MDKPNYDFKELEKFNAKPEIKIEKIDRSHLNKDKYYANDQIIYEAMTYLDSSSNREFRTYIKFIQHTKVDNFYLYISFNGWKRYYEITLIGRVNEGIKIYNKFNINIENINELINNYNLNILEQNQSNLYFYVHDHSTNEFVKKEINCSKLLIELDSHQLKQLCKKFDWQLKNNDYEIKQFSFSHKNGINTILAFYLSIVYSKSNKKLNYENKLNIIKNEINIFTKYEQNLIIDAFLKHNYKLFKEFEQLSNDKIYMSSKRLSKYYNRDKRSSQSQRLKDIAKIYNANYDVEDEIEFINCYDQDW